MRIAVFPGSFDPITIGHFDLIMRSLPLFDKVIVALGTNETKTYLFSVEQRLNWLEKVFANEPRVSIAEFEGLTATFCKQVNADFLIRGLRNSSDFEYEKTISQVNQLLSGGVETVFLISSPQYAHISSSIVREVIKGRGDAKQFLPDGVTI